MNKYKDKVDVEKLNETISVGSKVLKILYTLLIIILIYSLTLIIKAWGIVKILLTLLGILTPFFIGYVLAWLLNPLVNYLEGKNIKRPLAVVIVYLLLIVVIGLVIWMIVPPIINQIGDTTRNLTVWITEHSSLLSDFFIKLDPEGTLGLASVEGKIYESLLTMVTNIGTNLPNTIISAVTSLASGIGTVLIALVIGFYMLFKFNNVSKFIRSIVPTKHRVSAYKLMDKSSDILHEYIIGTLLVSLLIFVTCLIGFAIIGLKNPLLFAVICGITNLIPYVGPYIGAVPAILVGFAQDPVVGILITIFIIIDQTLEGNFLTPMVMSKRLDIHPVTVIVMLLIFGHFFGIIGMILATPIAAILKVFIEFLNDKYHFYDKIGSTRLKKEAKN